MKTIDVTMTVRDENGNVTHQQKFIRNESFMTWECNHSVWDPTDVEGDTDDGGNLPTCGWCESQGMESTLKPVEAVLCEQCDEYYEVEHFIKHHVGECGS